MNSVMAIVGEQNVQAAVWLTIGSLLLSNIGLIAGAAIKFFRGHAKMRADLNEAFKRIRALEKQQTLSQENER